MTAFLFRILLFVVIVLLIWFGARRIWRDWKNAFKAVDKAKHKRDVAERSRPDVVTLTRDKDGKFRTPEERDRQ